MEKGIIRIGTVRSDHGKGSHLEEMARSESVVEVFPDFLPGLEGIEAVSYLEVYYLFDRAGPASLKGGTFQGRQTGIFATRNPERPSKIGMTRVKLLERRGSRLVVMGLDAWDGTPVIDIKPSDRIDNH